MRLSYPRWRKLAGELRGAIATCDDPYGNGCRFWRHYIVLCREHASHLDPS
jgi:hypothetical protein